MTQLVFATVLLAALSIMAVIAEPGTRWQTAVWVAYFPLLIHWFVVLVGHLGRDKEVS